MLLKIALWLLRREIQRDSDYAYNWHCNIASVALNAGVLRVEADVRAGAFMERAFGVNTHEMVISNRRTGGSYPGGGKVR